ncbi:MAG TPA: CDP-glycerol glycerophosphotransferase family protein, partial [Flavobacteriaceae bacterium]|nr:CDP-glycerol glycerophosphotransferase family protein [Flavobacteriaceae bacterium]
FNFLIQLISWLVPKKKGLIVFKQFHNPNQFTGNIKALILYITDNHPEYEAVLVSQNKAIIKEASKYDIKIESNHNSILKLLLRAQFIVLDVANPMLSSGRFNIIQVWHGSGFKNIGALHKSTNPNRGRFTNHTKKDHQNDRVVVTTSKADAKKKKLSFGTNNNAITGLPRNDIFFSPKNSNNKIKKVYSLQFYDKIISYTPTFRDYETFPPFTEKNWQELNEILKVQNYVFVVKKHPWDSLISVPSNYSNIIDLSNTIKDVQELLLITDILISDYSSIVTDFAITGKPMLFYMYDFELYKKDRSIYYDLPTILPKPIVYDSKDFLSKIKNLSWLNSNEYLDSYAKFQEMFHRYKDGNSCMRVVEEIKKLN